MKIEVKAVYRQSIGFRRCPNKGFDNVMYDVELVTAVNNVEGVEGYDSSIPMISGVCFQVTYSQNSPKVEGVKTFDDLKHCQNFIDLLDDKNIKLMD